MDPQLLSHVLRLSTFALFLFINLNSHSITYKTEAHSNFQPLIINCLATMSARPLSARALLATYSRSHVASRSKPQSIKKCSWDTRDYQWRFYIFFNFPTSIMFHHLTATQLISLQSRKHAESRTPPMGAYISERVHCLVEISQWLHVSHVRTEIIRLISYGSRSAARKVI